MYGWGKLESDGICILMEGQNTVSPADAALGTADEHDATGRIAIGSDTCTACRYGITWIYRKLLRFKITIPWFIKLYFTRKKAMIYVLWVHS